MTSVFPAQLLINLLRKDLCWAAAPSCAHAFEMEIKLVECFCHNTNREVEKVPKTLLSLTFLQQASQRILDQPAGLKKTN